MTIVEFLQARISEDEARAEKASVSMHGERHDSRRSYSSYVLSSERDSTEDQDEFILQWWPARVLAECAVKRALIEHAEDASGDRASVISEYCVGQAEQNEAWETDPGTLILKVLAAVYKDHPDFQEAWA